MIQSSSPLELKIQAALPVVDPVGKAMIAQPARNFAARIATVCWPGH
jgi:hypothetical protein